MYGQYSEAAQRGDLNELLDLVADPALDRELLAVIAPTLRDKDAEPELIHRVLDHPACSEGIAARYTTHHDAEVRLRVATFPNIGSAVLAILAIDADDRVRDAAARRLGATSAPNPDHS